MPKPQRPSAIENAVATEEVDRERHRVAEPPDQVDVVPKARDCLTLPMLPLKLAEQILCADEMVVENTSGDVQKVTDEGVANGVPDADTFFASGDDIR